MFHFCFQGICVLLRKTSLSHVLLPFSSSDSPQYGFNERESDNHQKSHHINFNMGGKLCPSRALSLSLHMLTPPLHPSSPEPSARLITTPLWSQPAHLFFFFKSPFLSCREQRGPALLFMARDRGAYLRGGTEVLAVSCQRTLIQQKVRGNSHLIFPAHKQPEGIGLLRTARYRDGTQPDSAQRCRAGN